MIEVTAAGASSAARIPQSGIGHEPRALQLPRHLFSGRARKAGSAVGPKNAHRMRHTLETRFDVEGELPAEEAEDGMFRARLLGAGRQRAHHFFIQPRGIAQAQTSSTSL